MNSSKSLKKLERKLRRHQHTVEKEASVLCTPNPNKILAICNAGQINGLTEDIIFEHFANYGELERIMLIPGKSCSFLSFKDIQSAIKAFSETNGALNIAQDNKPIYLSYIEALPNISEDKTYGILPPGLFLLENFVNETEELDLLNLCTFNNNNNNNNSANSNMKHREVKHFGYEFRYDINNVDKDEPLDLKIPEKCNYLFTRLNNRAILKHPFEPDQLTVNCYKAGQGIPPHIDTHSAFEDPILSLSLGSDVVMEFKRNNTTICVLLPRRSLLIMSGESRYDWTHGITPKKYDFYYLNGECKSFARNTRVSFTFRKVLKGECNCDYKQNCDSYNKSRSQKTAIDGSMANILEQQHVHQVYEDIAHHFSDTRHKPWPNVLQFVKKFTCGDVLVDIGCGNGKYFGHNKNIFELGTDRSFQLNKLCRDRGFETFTGNCLNIPLKDSIADGVISIAVIHHLATEERRLQALSEIVRILRKGGRALIYVWAKKQVQNNEKSTYIKQDRKNRKSQAEIVSKLEDTIAISPDISLPVHTNRTDFKHNDLLVPWKLKNEDAQSKETFLRFYHVFEEGELNKICTKIGSVEIIKSYYDQGNHCIIFEKR